MSNIISFDLMAPEVSVFLDIAEKLEITMGRGSAFHTLQRRYQEGAVIPSTKKYYYIYAYIVLLSGTELYFFNERKYLGAQSRPSQRQAK